MRCNKTSPSFDVHTYRNILTSALDYRFYRHLCVRIQFFPEKSQWKRIIITFE
jgi:hypothetical protein